MDYQEIVTSYKNKGLDITLLKQKLETAKPLKGREKFRALDMIAKRSAIINDTNNILIISEIPEKLEVFDENLNNILEEYFLMLINSIKKAKAWKFMKLIPVDYSKETFDSLNTDKKFSMIFELNKNYLAFLEYQKIADIRDCLKNGKTLNDETILKLEFLGQMFNSLKNKEVKNEFFCFDKTFLMSLIDFRKSKSLRLEEFIKTRKKTVQQEYQKFSRFFSNEDFRDISENLLLTSKTLKISINYVIEAFGELSESEAEITYLEEESKELRKLEKKYLRMKVKRIQFEKQLRKQKLAEFAKKVVEDKKRKEEEELLKKKQTEEKIALAKQIVEERKRQAEEKVKEQLKDQEKEYDINNIAKEQVNPLIFSWLDREDVTIARKIGLKKLTEFFDKIKKIQNETGVRVSLYIVTNVGKEIALKRMIDFQKKATTQGLPDLIEGVLGGYSSFRIDSDGNITDISTMSEINKQKIITLLENANCTALNREIIDKTEDCYIRYQLADRKTNSINRDYLNILVNNLLKDEVVRRQPIKFLPFMEKKYTGIDVVLESQLKGISQLPEYYRSKYSIAPGKTMNAKIDNIDAFIGEN